MTVYEALAAVMQDVQAVRKSDRNTQQNFTFRGIDAVINAVGPALRKHGVTVSPKVDLYEHGSVTTSGGKPMGHVRVLVTYTFYGPEGDAFPAQAAGEAFDAGDKATPKAMSVAYRTALLQSLALPTDEPDPDAHAYQREEPAPPSLDDLLEEVRQATTGAALSSLARKAVAVHAAGYLSDDDIAQIKAAVTARREEFKATT